jgi:hypothetical protein
MKNMLGKYRPATRWLETLIASKLAGGAFGSLFGDAADPANVASSFLHPYSGTATTSDTFEDAPIALEQLNDLEQRTNSRMENLRNEQANGVLLRAYIFQGHGGFVIISFCSYC